MEAYRLKYLFGEPGLFIKFQGGLYLKWVVFYDKKKLSIFNLTMSDEKRLIILPIWGKQEINQGMRIQYWTEVNKRPQT